MKVIELRPKLDCEDIAKALRNIADEIEAGEYDPAPTMGVLVLGHETQSRDRTSLVDHYGWQTHGLGKIGYFAARGLLAAALTKWEAKR